MSAATKTISFAFLSGVIALASLLPASAFAQAGASYDGKPVRIKPNFPVLNLGERSQGKAAIAKLGGRLPEVAAYYGMTPAEFAKQMRDDKSAWLDKSGRVLHIEQSLGLPPGDGLNEYSDEAVIASSGTLPLVGAVYAMDQTFLLHSRPNSKRKVYLDFTGHTTTGTAWNNAYGVDPIINPAYDTDGVPGTFNTAELTAIQNIWRRVSEDFAAFDVDVTTEEPSADQLTRSSSADDIYGTRAVITRNFSGCGCGGFAYVGVFDAIGDGLKPAFVFHDMLGNGEKNIAEATTHEVGHNAGLWHDGGLNTGYYSGHGTGDTGWAPIMGVGYYKNLVQWSKGEYAGATNKEDDFATMHSNGIAYAPDDFGNTKASAAVLAPTALNGINTFEAQGVINSPTDVDSFKFSSAAGWIGINARPFNKSPNLDMLVLLRDAAGTIVASANPADALNGIVNLYRPAGTYWVSVQGTNKGDPMSGGYSNYGSIGRYLVTVTAPVPAASAIPVSAPSLSATTGVAPKMITFSGAGSAGTIALYEWNFADGTPVATGVNASHAYQMPGVYNASLRVTSTAGYSDIRAVTITIQ